MPTRFPTYYYYFLGMNEDYDELCFALLRRCKPLPFFENRIV